VREAQRLAVRDEVRHIGIGVSYARRRLTPDGARARALIAEIVDGFQALGDSLLEETAPGVLDDFAGAYGAEHRGRRGHRWLLGAVDNFERLPARVVTPEQRLRTVTVRRHAVEVLGLPHLDR
jgi:hypothetical protein